MHTRHPRTLWLRGGATVAKVKKRSSGDPPDLALAPKAGHDDERSSWSPSVAPEWPPLRALWSGVRMVASARACSSQIRRSHRRARHGSGTSLYLRHVIYPPTAQTKFFCNRCGSPSTLADDAAVGRTGWTGIFPVGSPVTRGSPPEPSLLSPPSRRHS